MEVGSISTLEEDCIWILSGDSLAFADEGERKVHKIPNISAGIASDARDEIISDSIGGDGAAELADRYLIFAGI